MCRLTNTQHEGWFCQGWRKYMFVLVSFMFILDGMFIIYDSRTLSNAPVINYTKYMECPCQKICNVLFQGNTLCHHSCKDAHSPADTLCLGTQVVNMDILDIRYRSWCPRTFSIDKLL